MKVITGSYQPDPSKPELRYHRIKLYAFGYEGIAAFAIGRGGRFRLFKRLPCGTVWLWRLGAALRKASSKGNVR